MADEINLDTSVVAETYRRGLSRCSGLDYEDLIQQSRVRIQERVAVWESMFKRFATYDDMPEMNEPLVSEDNSENDAKYDYSECAPVVTGNWEGRLKFQKSRNAIQNWINTSNSFTGDELIKEKPSPEMEDEPTLLLNIANLSTKDPSVLLRDGCTFNKETLPPLLEDEHVSNRGQSPMLQSDNLCTREKSYQILENNHVLVRETSSLVRDDLSSTTRKEIQLQEKDFSSVGGNVSPPQQIDHPTTKRKRASLKQEDILSTRGKPASLQQDSLSTFTGEQASLQQDNLPTTRAKQASLKQDILSTITGEASLQQYNLPTTRGKQASLKQDILSTITGEQASLQQYNHPTTRGKQASLKQNILSTITGEQASLQQYNLPITRGKQASLKQNILSTITGEQDSLQQYNLPTTRGKQASLKQESLSTITGEQASLQQYNLRTTRGKQASLKQDILSTITGEQASLQQYNHPTTRGKQASPKQDSLSTITGEQTSLQQYNLRTTRGKQASLKQNILSTITGEQASLQQYNLPTTRAKQASLKQDSISTITGEQASLQQYNLPTTRGKQASLKQDSISTITGEQASLQQYNHPITRGKQASLKQDILPTITGEQASLQQYNLPTTRGKQASLKQDILSTITGEQASLQQDNLPTTRGKQASLKQDILSTITGEQTSLQQYNLPITRGKQASLKQDILPTITGEQASLQQYNLHITRGNQASLKQDRLSTITGEKASLQKYNLPTTRGKQTSPKQDSLSTITGEQASLQQDNLPTTRAKQASLKQDSLSTITGEQASLQQDNVPTTRVKQASLKQDSISTITGEQASLKQDSISTITGEQASLQQDNLPTTRAKQASLKQDSISTITGEQASLQQDNLPTTRAKQASLKQDSLSTITGEQASLQQDNLPTTRAKQTSLKQDSLSTITGEQASLQQDNHPTTRGKQTSLKQDSLSTITGEQTSLQQDNLPTTRGKQASLKQDSLSTITGEQASLQQDNLPTTRGKQTSLKQDILSTITGEQASLQQDNLPTTRGKQTSLKQDILSTITGEQASLQQDNLPTTRGKQASLKQDSLSTITGEQASLQQDNLPTTRGKQASLKQDILSTITGEQASLQQYNLPTTRGKQTSLQQDSISTITGEQVSVQQDIDSSTRGKQASLKQGTLSPTKRKRLQLVQSEAFTLSNELEVCDETGMSSSYSVFSGLPKEYLVGGHNTKKTLRPLIMHLHHSELNQAKKSPTLNSTIKSCLDLNKLTNFESKYSSTPCEESVVGQTELSARFADDINVNISPKELLDGKCAHSVSSAIVGREYPRDHSDSVVLIDTDNRHSNDLAYNQKSETLPPMLEEHCVVRKLTHSQNKVSSATTSAGGGNTGSKYSAPADSPVFAEEKIYSSIESRITRRDEMAPTRLGNIEFEENFSKESSNSMRPSKGDCSFEKSSSFSDNTHCSKFDDKLKQLVNHKAVSVNKKGLPNSSLSNALHHNFKDVSRNVNLESKYISPLKRIETKDHKNSERGNLSLQTPETGRADTHRMNSSVGNRCVQVISGESESSHDVTEPMGSVEKYSNIECPQQDETKHNCKSCFGLKPCKYYLPSVSVNLSSASIYPISTCEGDQVGRDNSPDQSISNTSASVGSKEYETTTLGVVDPQHFSRLRHRRKRKRLPAFGQHHGLLNSVHGENENTNKLRISSTNYMNVEHSASSDSYVVEPGSVNRYKSRQSSEISLGSFALNKQHSENNSDYSVHMNTANTEHQRRNTCRGIEYNNSHQGTESLQVEQSNTLQKNEDYAVTGGCTESLSTARVGEESPSHRMSDNTRENSSVLCKVSPLTKFDTMKHPYYKYTPLNSNLSSKSIGGRCYKHMNLSKPEECITVPVNGITNTDPLNHIQTLNQINSFRLGSTDLNDINVSNRQFNKDKGTFSSEKIGLLVDSVEQNGDVKRYSDNECTRLKNTKHECKGCSGLQSYKCNCIFSAQINLKSTDNSPVEMCVSASNQINSRTSPNQFIINTNRSVDCNKNKTTLDGCDLQRSSRLKHQNRRKRLPAFGRHNVLVKLAQYQKENTSEFSSADEKNTNAKCFTPPTSRIQQLGLSNECKSRQSNEIPIRIVTLRKCSENNTDIAVHIDGASTEFQRGNLCREIEYIKSSKENAHPETDTYEDRQGSTSQKTEDYKVNDVCAESASLVKVFPSDRMVDYTRENNLVSSQASSLTVLDTLKHSLSHKSPLVNSKGGSELIDSNSLKRIRMTYDQEKCKTVFLNGNRVPESTDTGPYKHSMLIDRERAPNLDSINLSNGSRCMNLNNEEEQSSSDKIDLVCDFMEMAPTGLGNIEFEDNFSKETSNSMRPTKGDCSFEKSGSVSGTTHCSKFDDKLKQLVNHKAVSVNKKGLPNSTLTNALHHNFKDVSRNVNLESKYISPLKRIETKDHKNSERGNLSLQTPETGRADTHRMNSSVGNRCVQVISGESESSHDVTEPMGSVEKYSNIECPQQDETKHNCKSCFGLKPCKYYLPSVSVNLSSASIYPISTCEGDQVGRDNSPDQSISNTSASVGSKEYETTTLGVVDPQHFSRLRHRRKRKRLPAFGQHHGLINSVHSENENTNKLRISSTNYMNVEHSASSDSYVLEPGSVNRYKSRQSSEISLGSFALNKQHSENNSDYSVHMNTANTEHQRRNTCRGIEYNNSHQGTESLQVEQSNTLQKNEDYAVTGGCTESLSTARVGEESPSHRMSDNTRENSSVLCKVSPLTKFDTLKHPYYKYTPLNSNLSSKSIGGRCYKHMNLSKPEECITVPVNGITNTDPLNHIQTLNQINSFRLGSSDLNDINVSNRQFNKDKGTFSSEKIGLLVDSVEQNGDVKRYSDNKCTRLKNTKHECKGCSGLQSYKCNCIFSAQINFNSTDNSPVEMCVSASNQINSRTSPNQFIINTNRSVDCNKNKTTLDGCDLQRSSRLKHQTRRKRLPAFGRHNVLVKLAQYQKENTSEFSSADEKNTNAKCFTPPTSRIQQLGLSNECKSRQSNEIPIRIVTLRKCSENNTDIAVHIDGASTEFQRGNLCREIEYVKSSKENVHPETDTYEDRQGSTSQKTEDYKVNDVCAESASLVKVFPSDRMADYTRENNLLSSQASSLTELDTLKHSLSPKSPLVNSKGGSELIDSNSLKRIRMTYDQEKCKTVFLNGNRVPESTDTGPYKHSMLIDRERGPNLDNINLSNGSKCKKLCNEEEQSSSDKIDLVCDFMELGEGVKKHSVINCTALTESKSTCRSCLGLHACEDNCTPANVNLVNILETSICVGDHIEQFTAQAGAISSGNAVESSQRQQTFTVDSSDRQRPSLSRHRKRRKRLPAFGRHNVLSSIKL